MDDDFGAIIAGDGDTRADRAVIIAISLKRKRPTTSPWQWVDYFYCSLHVDSRLFTSHTQSPNVESLDCEITAC